MVWVAVLSCLRWARYVTVYFASAGGILVVCLRCLVACFVVCCGLGCGCFTFTGLYLVGFVVVLGVVALRGWYTVCFFVVWFLFLGLLAGCFAWREVLWCVVVGVFLGYVYCVGW